MHQQTQALVTRVDSGAISYLTLNRPTAGNSLSLDTIDALHRHLIDLRAERSISVIVLAGTGSRIFCAGHDLREFLDDGGTPEFSKEVVASRFAISHRSSSPRWMVWRRRLAANWWQTLISRLHRARHGLPRQASTSGYGATHRRLR